jgi:hypothetical protein
MRILSTHHTTAKELRTCQGGPCGGVGVPEFTKMTTDLHFLSSFNILFSRQSRHSISAIAGIQGMTDSTPERALKHVSEGRMGTLAKQIWATPELRRMIVDQMDREDVAVSLCLDSDSFPTMVQKLYHHLHYSVYDEMTRMHISVGRRSQSRLM